jgi:hypothetical protein
MGLAVVDAGVCVIDVLVYITFNSYRHCRRKEPLHHNSMTMCLVGPLLIAY